MPILTIQGLPTRRISDAQLANLTLTRLPEAVAAIDDLQLSSNQVTVHVMCQKPDQLWDVIVFIDALMANTLRTREVKQQLTDVVAQVVREFLAEVIENFSIQPLRLIEVFIRSKND